MEAEKAFAVIGKKLEKEYKKLGFKYSKKNKFLKKSTKKFGNRSRLFGHIIRQTQRRLTPFEKRGQCFVHAPPRGLLHSDFSSRPEPQPHEQPGHLPFRLSRISFMTIAATTASMTRPVTIVPMDCITPPYKV
jgi:hypothetical protein